MQSKQLIEHALRMSDGAMMGLIHDLRDAPLTQPTPRGGNHPLWVLGHITFIEAGLPSVLFGQPHALERWAPLFAPGTEPRTDARAYPPLDEVLKAYQE